MVTALLKAWLLVRARTVLMAGGKIALDVWLADWEHAAADETKNRLTPHGKRLVRRICRQIRKKFDLPGNEGDTP